MADDFLSDEDKALFREYMRAVTPLNEKKKGRKTLAPESTTYTSKTASSERKEKKEYYLSDFIVDTVHSETMLSYAHPSLTNQRFKALKNGQIPWEAQLDLHGLKSDTAREALCHFIQIQVQNEKRCVLIIHGKGGYQGAPPIIKNLLNRWLTQFDEVLAFHSALPKHGGNGAVYVLLKRRQERS
jgi:DNA-nicking Smr family endonuclease